MQNKKQIVKVGLMGFLTLLLLNFPFLLIANKKGFFGTFPNLFLYVFGCWISMIIIIAITLERPFRKNK